MTSMPSRRGKLPGIESNQDAPTIHFQFPDSAFARVTGARGLEGRPGHVGCGGSAEEYG